MTATLQSVRGLLHGDGLKTLCLQGDEFAGIRNLWALLRIFLHRQSRANAQVQQFKLTKER